MNTHKLNGLLTVLTAYVVMPVYGQVKEGSIILPAVAAAKTANCRVYSTWKPARKFLKHNPDFLKNGSYAMSRAYIKKGRQRKAGYWRARQNGLFLPAVNNFTSAGYPADYVPSTRKINTGGNVYIQVLQGSNSQSLFPLGKGPHANKSKNTGYFSNYAEVMNHPLFRDAYANLNNYYRQKAKEIAARKFTNPVYISDIGSTTIPTSESGPNDLFFEFEYVDVQSVTQRYLAADMVLYFPVPCLMFFMPWDYALMTTRRKSGTAYPSNLLLQLHVTDDTGKVLKTYSQAVFVNERHLVGFLAGQNYAVSTRSMILQQALPTAMESLINRFAEDSAVWQQINDRNQKTKQITAQHPAITRWANLETKLDEIDDSKNAVRQLINEVNNNIGWLGAGAPGGYSPDVSSELGNMNISSNAKPGATAAVMAGIVILDFGVYAITGAINNAEADKQIIFLQGEHNNLLLQYQQLLKDEAATKKEIVENSAGAAKEMISICTHIP